MSSDDRLAERRSRRIRFLRLVYDRSNADVASFQEGIELAEELGIPYDEAGRIVRYYEELGYLKHVGGAGFTLRITAAGVDHIESDA